MLQFYKYQDNSLKTCPYDDAKNDLNTVVWIDLFEPTGDEEILVEKLLNAEVPTREEMHEIELSSRLYQENGAVYAIATIVTNQNTAEPEAHSITFVLVKNWLVTVRYVDLQSFKIFLARVERETCQQIMAPAFYWGYLKQAQTGLPIRWKWLGII